MTVTGAGLDVEVARLAAGLSLAGEALAQLRVLAEVGPPSTSVDLAAWASGTDPSAVLTRLGLNDDDRRDTLANRPDPERDADLWWLLERCHQQLVRQLGTTGPLPPWPDLPAETGAVGRFIYVWTFLATLPSVGTTRTSASPPMTRGRVSRSSARRWRTVASCPARAVCTRRTG
jgi:N-acyltransferase N-terminal domain